MKKIFLLMLFVISLFSSQKAITDTGEEVILNDDKTWYYVDKIIKDNSKIPTNNTIFKKTKNSNFLLKSTRNNSAFWINTKKWNFSRIKPLSAKEYNFKFKNEDLYAMAINEKIQANEVSLSNIALSIAKKAAHDAKILKREYRIVNGNKLIYMELSGTIKSIRFTYFGYYYSDKSGSTQFVVFTASNLVDKYKKNIIDLLNGFDIQNK